MHVLTLAVYVLSSRIVTKSDSYVNDAVMIEEHKIDFTLSWSENGTK